MGEDDDMSEASKSLKCQVTNLVKFHHLWGENPSCDIVMTWQETYATRKQNNPIGVLSLERQVLCWYTWINKNTHMYIYTYKSKYINIYVYINIHFNINIYDMNLKLFSGSPFFHKTSFPTRLLNQTCQTFSRRLFFSQPEIPFRHKPRDSLLEHWLNHPSLNSPEKEVVAEVFNTKKQRKVDKSYNGSVTVSVYCIN